MKTLTAFIPILLIALCLSPAQAQKKGKLSKEERAAKRAKMQEELNTFLKKYYPEDQKELAALKDGEDKEAYRGALAEHRELFMDYKYVVKKNGEEAAENMIKEDKAWRVIDGYITKYEKADKEGKAALQKEMEGPMAKLHALRIANIKAEIEAAGDDPDMKEFLGEDLEELTKTDDPAKLVANHIEELEAYAAEEKKYKAMLPEDWHYDPKKAMIAAKESGKPIHVVFSTSWCGPCKAMAKSVYPQDNVKKALEPYEALYVDGDKYMDVCRKYKVNGFPTFIVIDADGKLLRTCPNGGMNANTFIDWLESDD